VKAVRASLIVVILLNLALLAVSGPLRATLARYELAKKQTELRKLALENRALLGSVAQSRRPDRVAAKAASMGVSLQMIETEAVAGALPSDRKPVAPAPPALRR
jgi:cell division protein FtsL